MTKQTDHGADTLLVLDGTRMFVDEHGEFEAIFRVSRVSSSPGRLHGLSYSLVLLDAKGNRVVGFDNAHAANTRAGPGKKPIAHFDHKHVGDRVVPYRFKDSLTLIEDYWNEVEKCLQRRHGKD